ncbi:MAG: Ig-like domain-containing protein, partial [Gemmatimonadota bacterium]
MDRRSRIVRFAALAFAALAGAACSGSEAGGVSTPSAPPVEQLVVRIAQKDDSILIGSSRTLSAAVTTTAGAPRSAPITWTSLNPAIASISGNTVTAYASGEARIVASIGTSADTGRLVVTLPPFELRLSPGAVSAMTSDTIQFQAMVVGPNNATSVPNDVQWALSDSTSARIAGDGAVTTVSEGDLQVFATVDGITASASMKVTGASVASITIVPGNLALAVGGSALLVAEMRDDRGRVITSRDAKWKSSNTSVATVDADGR